MLGKHLTERNAQNTKVAESGDSKDKNDAASSSKNADKKAAKRISASKAGANAENAFHTFSAGVLPSFDVPFTHKPDSSDISHNREKNRLIREGTDSASSHRYGDLYEGRKNRQKHGR